MANETKPGGAAGGSAALGGGGGGFRQKMTYYLYSGDKKHVFGGLVILSALFGVPWVLMNRGSTHQSHQDYMDKADRARNERLSASASKTAV